MHASILFVEDEEALQLTVGDRLRSACYVVESAANGNEALEKAIVIGFDCIILDVMLPGKDGFDVCRDIRQAGLITPILMLTARRRTSDKVTGLKLGADDYLTKPFDMQELMARVEALLRRAPIRPPAKQSEVRFADVTVDMLGTEVTRGGSKVALSAREFQLLQYFIEHPGVTVSRDDLLREVWGYRNGTFSRTVDVHVASLRQKIEADPKTPKCIVTVKKLGYKFTP